MPEYHKKKKGFVISSLIEQALGILKPITNSETMRSLEFRKDLENSIIVLQKFKNN